MKVFKPVRKAGKFAFVTLPLSLVGWELNKRLFLFAKRSLKRSLAPACPVCDEGWLERFSVPDQEEESVAHPPWRCRSCEFSLPQGLDAAAARKAASEVLGRRAMDHFNQIERDERSAIAAKHRISSRIFFVFATLTFLFGIYLVAATQASVMVVFSWFSFAFMFWTLGMKRSYRAWQVMSGHIFEKGAAKHWFRQEKWLI